MRHRPTLPSINPASPFVLTTGTFFSDWAHLLLVLAVAGAAAAFVCLALWVITGDYSDEKSVRATLFRAAVRLCWGTRAPTPFRRSREQPVR